MSADIAHSIVTQLVGRHIAAGRGDDPAVIDDTGAWSYAELDHASACEAGAQRARGVAAGDRVAVVMADSRAWCAAFLGALRLGACAVPLDPQAPTLARTLTALEPTLVVADPDTPLPDGTPRMAPDTSAAPVDVTPVAPDSLAYMIFSSGSTGWPKGVMHAHRDLTPSLEGYAHEVLGLQPGERTYSVAKLFASLGFGNGFFRPLGRGACAVLSARKPTVRQVLSAVATHRVTVLSGVPTFWSQLARFLERHPDAGDLSGVRLAVSSGDSLPAAVLERIRDQTGVDLVEGFGCSECSNVILSVRPGEWRPGTVGRPVSGVEIMLADSDGTPVPAGEPGRLWVRSPSNTTGYWRRPEETADLVHGPWLRMGDVLREQDGVYRHVGRSDDLFKVDGLWVSPVEVEDVLYTHPSVGAAAVVARSDADGLERVTAFLEGADGVPPDAEEIEADLRKRVARQIAPYAAPSTFTWLETLPRGATGKVNRRLLREGADAD